MYLIVHFSKNKSISNYFHREKGLKINKIRGCLQFYVRITDGFRNHACNIIMSLYLDKLNSYKRISSTLDMILP